MTYSFIRQVLLLLICIPIQLGIVFTASATELHFTAADESLGSLSVSQANISMSSGQTAFVSFENIDGLAVLEGDIVLGPSRAISRENNHYSAAGASVSTQYSLWGDNTIPYQISPSISSQTTINRIYTAIAHWQDKTQLKFVARSVNNAASYPDYIEFIPSTGCSSYVGKQGGKQNIWVGSYCTSGNIIHEIGHAAGLFHEHIRSDRDNYVTVHWGNIKEGKSHNFNNQISSQSLGAYDYGSVMHYGAHSFSKNGQATITTKGVESIGQRSALSSGDIATINALYGYSLAGSITHSSSLVEPNDHFSIQLSLINQGVGDFTQAGISIQLPAGVTFDSYSSQSGWVCIENADSALQCTLPDEVPAGTGESLTLNLLAPEYGNPLTFTAQFLTADDELEKMLDITVNSDNFPPKILKDQEITSEISSLHDGKVIGTVAAHDPNLDDIELYEIVSGNSEGAFSLNSLTGEVIITDKTAISTSSTTYSLEVRASDYELMSEPTSISIRLLDAIDAYATVQPGPSSSSSSSDSGGGASDFYLLLILLLMGYQRVNRGTASSSRAV